MPANLPPQYYELERAYRAERDPREKLRMAEELLRMMPKHKGTDKLQADMKSKISKHKKEIEGGGGKAGGAARTATAMDSISKEGAGQVILIGPPNCGKSSLLDTLTGAKPLVGQRMTMHIQSSNLQMVGMLSLALLRLKGLAESMCGYLI